MRLEEWDLRLRVFLFFALIGLGGVAAVAKAVEALIGGEVDRIVALLDRMDIFSDRGPLRREPGALESRRRPPSPRRRRRRPPAPYRSRRPRRAGRRRGRRAVSGSHLRVSRARTPAVRTPRTA